MIIQTNTSQLKTALYKVSQAAKKSKTLPILGNVLISATDTVRLSCSNLEQFVTVDLPGACTEDQGETTVPARELYWLIKAMPQGPVTLELDELSLLVKAGSDVIRLPATEADEFPMCIPDLPSSFELDGQTLRHLLRVRVAAAVDDARPLIMQVHFEMANGKITASATDGFWLMSISSPIEYGGSGEFMLPIQAVDYALRNIPSKEKVTIRFSAGLAKIDASGIQLHTTYYEGKFPEWRKIVPGNPGHALKIGKAALIGITQQALLVQKITGYWHEPLRFHIESTTTRASFKASDEQIEYSTSAPCSYDGNPIDIAINPRFLLGVLQSIPDPEPVIYISAKNAPILIRNPDRTYLAVIMPLFTD